MAHLIENNEMAYVGSKPWHGLGVEVAKGATGAEMLKAAGLEWQVQLRDLAFMLPGASGELIDPLQIYKAVTRSDNDKVFQVATKLYQPVQNEEIINFFHEYCEAGHAELETVGALKGGAIVWALAKLSAEASKTIMGDDKIEGRMLFATSHDSSMQTIGRATQVRVVCWNTINAALRDFRGRDMQFRMSHSRKWTSAVADEARQAMGMAVEQVARTNEIAEVLAGITISSNDWLDFMGKLMGQENVVDEKKNALTRTAQAIKDATVSSPGSNLKSAKGTLWGAINGITYFADHKRGKTQDNRLAASWFGDGERLKNDALNIAIEMAGVR